MISTSKVRPGGLGHYHSKEDRDEKPGHWLGKGAKQIQLRGEVKTEDLTKVAHGKAPNGVRIKKQRSEWRSGQYRDNHQAGVDNVFSPPKSVSILGEVGGDQRLYDFHKIAVEKTVNKIERECIFAVVRTGGQRKREYTGNAIVATFDHHVTRPDDNGLPMPQIHTHTIIFSPTLCSDGKWRSHDNVDYYKHRKHELRKHYIGELGQQMREVGYGIKFTRDGLHFEVDGVSREQELAYSGRTAQIERELGTKAGKASIKQKRIATLKTRKEKADIPFKKLRKKWREIAERVGLRFDRVKGFRETPKEIPLQKRVALQLAALQVMNRVKDQTRNLHGKWDRQHGTVDPGQYKETELMKLYQPLHLSDKHWEELVIGSGIAPHIASASFKTVDGKESEKLIIGHKLERIRQYGGTYIAKRIRKTKAYWQHLRGGGLWCGGVGDYGQLKPEIPRVDDKGKPIKYESPPGKGLGIMLPEGDGIDWDEIRKDSKIPVGITEGKKKAASASSRGLNTIALAGMNGGLKNGDLRPDLKAFEWEGRKVYLVLDKDPSHKHTTLKDAARELYKLGTMLEYYGADVTIGTIPGKLKEKVGLDDHLVKGKSLSDLKWQTLDDFADRSPYLSRKYKAHNKDRVAKEYHHKENPILRKDGTVNDLRFNDVKPKEKEKDQDRDLDFDR